LKSCEGFDPADPFSRTPTDWPAIKPFDPAHFRFGVPRADQLQFFGDLNTPALFQSACSQMVELGGTPVEIDFAPFAQAARLLYHGPWLAERYGAIKAQNELPPTLLEVTRRIVEPGKNITAVQAFEALYQLAALRQQTRQTWEKIDCLLLPTTGTIYTRQQIEADPIQLNVNLGYYTNFTNLLDLTAVALPAGFAKDRSPRGITIMAQAALEAPLLELGSRFQTDRDLPLGATNCRRSKAPVHSKVPEGWIQLAVLGAHLSGLPLNHQLTECGARLVRACQTAPQYRFYALPGTLPPKPGLVRAPEGGAAIDLEVWAMDAQSFGSFVAAIPPPLGIGTIELEDGSAVKGFVCEAYAVAGARDISGFGGWRAYLQSLKP
jgi:allophanate hydrolase